LVLFLLLTFSPILALVMEWLFSTLNGKLDWTSLVIPTARRSGLFIQTLSLAVMVALFDLVIGVLCASILWRWRRGAGSILRWGFIALAPLPPYIQAVTYESMIASANFLLKSFGLSAVNLQGWIGSWWVQSMAWLPMGTVLALIALESVDTAMIEAARLHHDDLHTFLYIVLPLAAPVLAASGGFLFLLSMMDYSVPSYFGLNVYALELFAEFSTFNDPVHTVVLSLPVLSAAALLILASQDGLRSAAQSPALSREPWRIKPRFRAWFGMFQWAALFLLLAQCCFTVASLAIATGNWHNFVFTLRGARSEILTTLTVALLASVSGLPAALAVAIKLLRQDKAARAWWLVVSAPLVFPPPLVGIGLISVWNHPGTSGIYTSLLMPVFASLARFTSLAAILLVAQLRRVDPLLIDAARMHERKVWTTWLWLRLPMLAPGLASAACLSFAFTLSELGATLLVVPGGMNTISLRIYNYLHYGATSQVASLCLLMMGMVIAVASPAVVALAEWRKLSARQWRETQ
jgi:iron(III) transport system permease protein